MKKFTKLLIFASLLMVLFALPGQVNAQTPTPTVVTNDNGKVVFGSTYTLPSGQALDGDLVVFGGSATIEKDAVVNGNVAIFGSTLSVSGHVTGNISAMGGSVNLNESAIVDGNVETMGVVLNQLEGAMVKGNTVTESPDQLNLPKIDPGNWLPNFGGAFRSIGSALWAVLRALALGLIALLISMLAPHPTRRVTTAITSAPAISVGMGLLTFFVAPALVLVLAITIILIPFSLLGVLVIIAAAMFAWAAVGQELGNRLAVLFKVQWAEPVAAGIGAAFLSLLVSLVSVIPCFNWILVIAVLAFGFGGIVLSRAGTQDYPHPAAPLRPASVAPAQGNPAPAPSVMPVIPEPKPAEPPSQGKDSNPQA
ncbi:polymer-forming cytoskeletal [Longilinea arvoryzae]|uniref:Polymer-forming cytoskeletal n=1 Tax=Longilinea arvoryzae TaxID=360412 RepID=A0A0S7BA35_9CHLR|nr:polymer-forming cytoskeletal protein [Longilinea arvoryzae]GAP14254.1 polymer-forming cytoskeletal [Longilinea arvoryzae]